MRLWRLAATAALVVAAAACGEDRSCNERTVLLTVTLAGSARDADEIEVRPSIGGIALDGGAVARPSGDARGTIEVVLGDRYMENALVSIVVIARAKTSVLAQALVMTRLAPGCSTLSITVGGNAPDAGSDVVDGPPPDGPGPPDSGPLPDGPMGDGPAPDGPAVDPPRDGPIDIPIDVPAPPDVVPVPDVRPDLPPDIVTPPARKRIFVSKDRYNGNLGGLDGAHGLCTQLAIVAGLTGSYKAWLSTAASGPASFMTHHPGPYLLPSGEMVAASWADLVDGSILHAIDRDQNGATADPQAICEGGEVWTNTTAAGTPIGAQDCVGWTSGASDVAIASAAGNVRFTNARWTNSGCTAIGCNSPLQIYCVEQ